MAGTKKPATGAGFSMDTVDYLLNLGFLVHHVFADHGIVFLHLHFFRSVPLVLVRGVKVTGFSGRHQADFIS
jgi:hypothetical protein